MGHWVLSWVESLLFIGMFLGATCFLVPKSVRCFRLWKSTDKMKYLSEVVAYGMIGFSFLSANFIMFIRAVLGVGNA